MSELIDLSKIAPPDAIQNVSYEAIRTAYLDDLKSRLANVGIDFDVDGLETDPLIINEEARAYREMLLLQRINDAVRSVLLSSATGNDLIQLAADFGLEKRLGETDDQLRMRRQLAPAAIAVGGPRDAYKAIAIEADSRVKDAVAVKGEQNRIDLVLQGYEGDGTVPNEVVTIVHDALSPQTKRPLTDTLIVRSCTATDTRIHVRIEIGSGPSASTVETEAMQGLKAYEQEREKIGSVLRTDGIIGGARKASGVERVILLEPLTDVDPGHFGVVNITDIEVEVVRV